MLRMRMAASSAWGMRGSRKVLPLVLALVASLLNAGVKAQEEDFVTTLMPPQAPEANVRGDMIPQTPKNHEQGDQVLVFPTIASLKPTEETTVAAPKEEGEQDNNAAPENVAEFIGEVQTNLPKILEPQTQEPQLPRGDGPANRPQVVAQEDVICVSQEVVQNRNAVNLKMKTSSSCENTRVKLQSVLQDLCGEDCKLEIFQQDRSDEIIVSGNYVEADVSGMTNKFNNDNIKDKTGVETAVPVWRQKSKLVLVSLLLIGLLLAALLVAGYYFKTHRKNSKGVRLAESFQVDEENQANTLVSVAPLPQEPLDKPTVNRESPPENGTNPSPTTNGHSASVTPVADTEM